ncbi:N-acetylmannosamine-6-phosphate 2-epimerase [Agromyces silvae]|uniref:N-acetylmannosamine-6-phosphate 2-epimerase n=1 Tax=Agromyces silvae TaxID=3388266 RepID=UPI00280BAB0C|nr:putative N-acetylmannosamine-6-phosphate 2-epimerase [Agromyces protaetiae]
MNIPEQIRGRLVVSCQAAEVSPFHDPDAMRIMTRAVVAAGASALRLESVAHVRAIAGGAVPVIGLVKRRTAGSEVYITPRVEDVVELAGAGASVVAMDGTPRTRPNGVPLADLVAAAHAHGALVMADVDGEVGAEHALEAGADWIGTTLAGYTGRAAPNGPDIALVGRLAAMTANPVIAEGRYSRQQEVAAAFEAGAWSVVVGTAISDPYRLTQQLIRACPTPTEVPS